jgi:hypothetical protein
MKYLIKTVEQYRVANENEAKQLIESAKTDRNYTLAKYSSEYKCSKSKGEVVDEWYRVILTKEFCTEKDPDTTATVSYNVEMGAFPEPVANDDEEEDSNEF